MCGSLLLASSTVLVLRSRFLALSSGPETTVSSTQLWVFTLPGTFSTISSATTQGGGETMSLSMVSTISSATITRLYYPCPLRDTSVLRHTAILIIGELGGRLDIYFDAPGSI
jgi:hypothetical protein